MLSATIDATGRSVQHQLPALRAASRSAGPQRAAESHHNCRSAKGGNSKRQLTATVNTTGIHYNIAASTEDAPGPTRLRARCTFRPALAVSLLSLITEPR